MREMWGNLLIIMGLMALLLALYYMGVDAYESIGRVSFLIPIICVAIYHIYKKSKK